VAGMALVIGGLALFILSSQRAAAGAEPVPIEIER
jgi:hypothetical protein